MKKPLSGYINLDPLKEEVAGDTAIFKKLIELFIHGIDEYINTMNIELKTNNWPALYQAVHKIKPSIRIFSIYKLEPIIIQLETTLRHYSDRNQDDIKRISKEINTSLYIINQVKVELENELKLMEDVAT